VSTKTYFNVKILRLKCTKFDFGWALPQTPLGELTALPLTPKLNLRDRRTHQSTGGGIEGPGV